MPRSKAAKFIHMFYLLVIATLVTLLFVERQEQGSEPELAAVSEQITQLQLSFEQRLNAFEQTVNTQLEQTNQAVASSTDESRISTAPPSSTLNPPINQRLNEPTGNENTANEPIDETEAETRRAPNSPRSNTAAQADLHATLSAGLLDDFEQKETQFSMQSVDPDWAYPTRDRIREQFNDNDYLSTLSLREIECRSSLCRIDLDVRSTETINRARLLTALNQINQNEDGHRYALRSSAQQTTYRILVERVSPANE